MTPDNRRGMRLLAALVGALTLTTIALAIRLGLSSAPGAPCLCPPSKFEGGAFHAQFYEDYVLSFVLEGVLKGTYVDVGASHPIKDSTTDYFYERGWSGITIEPNPEFVPLYAKLRPRDIHLNIGIAATRGTLTFFRVTSSSGARGASTEGVLSTFDRANADKARQAGLDVSELEVPVTTLNEVLASHPLATISLLSIDVEGFEKQVLESIDLRVHRPLVVMVEAVLPGTETPSYASWEGLLLAAGYAPAMSDGLNRYYVPRDRLDLLAKFVQVDMCVKRSKLARGVRLDGWMPLR
jgi:FkbM family methyltransferase